MIQLTLPVAPDTASAARPVATMTMIVRDQSWSRRRSTISIEGACSLRPATRAS